MTIQAEILHCTEGARQAAAQGAVTIVVDALRASCTAATALHIGAEAVLPVLSVDEAMSYCGKAGYRVAGERAGKKCDGFDFGNSPSELIHHQREMEGQTLVLSTSNGTRILQTAADGAVASLMGTTVNARAVARAAYRLSQATGRPIAIVAAGEFDNYAAEDECAARIIARHLHMLGVNVAVDLTTAEDASTIFAVTYSADELRELGYAKDISFCAQQDIFEVVPFFHAGRLVPFHTVELMQS